MGIAADDYVTVTQAATLLHVAPSTIRRWIREGVVPAYRIGRRRVALKRTDLMNLITPARAAGEKGDDTARGERAVIRPLTPEEQRRALAALERVERLQQRIVNERGGTPFSPSWELLNEARDERTRQLS